MNAQAERGTLYEAGSWAEIEACLFGPRPEDGGEIQVLALPSAPALGSPEGRATTPPAVPAPGSLSRCLPGHTYTS